MTELTVGWTGWYTKIGGTRWYRCTVIAFDDGAPVIKTANGYYRRRPTSTFDYSRHLPYEGTRS